MPAHCHPPTQHMGLSARVPPGDGTSLIKRDQNPSVVGDPRRELSAPAFKELGFGARACSIISLAGSHLLSANFAEGKTEKRAYNLTDQHFPWVQLLIWSIHLPDNTCLTEKPASADRVRDTLFVFVKKDFLKFGQNNFRYDFLLFPRAGRSCFSGSHTSSLRGVILQVSFLVCRILWMHAFKTQ